MPKNIEKLNPFFEESHEDEMRLYKNDKSHNYLPVDKIPSKDSFVLEQNESGDNNHNPSQKNEEIINKIRGSLNNKKINIREENGVTSVGPDIIGEEVIDEPVNKTVEREMITNTPPESMSAYKMNIDEYSVRKKDRNTGREHDNLKTFKKNYNKNNHLKIVRGLRQKLRNIFTGSFNDKNKNHKNGEDFYNFSINEEPDVVILNDKEVDEKYLDLN